MGNETVTGKKLAVLQEQWESQSMETICLLPSAMVVNGSKGLYTSKTLSNVGKVG